MSCWEMRYGACDLLMPVLRIAIIFLSLRDLNVDHLTRRKAGQWLQWVLILAKFSKI